MTSRVTTIPAHPPGSVRPRGLPLGCLIAVCLASILPFVSTLNGYFLSDDFGVVQLLSRKPTFHALSLFTSPWTEAIYGTPADELRPTLALFFQFNSQWGAAVPIAYHITNPASHMLTTLVVFRISAWTDHNPSAAQAARTVATSLIDAALPQPAGCGSSPRYGGVTTLNSSRGTYARRC